MGLIKSAAELPVPTVVKMLIYGQPGMGKTTLALSMPDCVLLDFDRGAYRVNNEHLQGVDFVEVETWQDIEQFVALDLSKYKTIVVDTAGKMIDAVIKAVCGERNPSIKDWSSINAKFKWFTDKMNALGKHQVYIAHRSERQQGDNRVFVPDMREKNFTALSTDLDLIGYCVVKNIKGWKKRTLSFDSSDEHEGKNTCSLPAEMQIPEIVDKNGNPVGNNDFLTKNVLTLFTANCKKKQEQNSAYFAVVAQITDEINAINSADDANAFVANIGKWQHVGSSKNKMRELFDARMKFLKLTYDKKAKAYV